MPASKCSQQWEARACLTPPYSPHPTATIGSIHNLLALLELSSMIQASSTIMMMISPDHCCFLTFGRTKWWWCTTLILGTVGAQLFCEWKIISLNYTEMKSSFELQRSDCNLRGDRRYVAFSTHLNGLSSPYGGAVSVGFEPTLY